MKSILPPRTFPLKHIEVLYCKKFQFQAMRKGEMYMYLTRTLRESLSEILRECNVFVGDSQYHPC